VPGKALNTEVPVIIFQTPGEFNGEGTVSPSSVAKSAGDADANGQYGGAKASAEPGVKPIHAKILTALSQAVALDLCDLVERTGLNVDDADSAIDEMVQAGLILEERSGTSATYRRPAETLPVGAQHGEAAVSTPAAEANTRRFLAIRLTPRRPDADLWPVLHACFRMLNFQHPMIRNAGSEVLLCYPFHIDDKSHDLVRSLLDQLAKRCNGATGFIDVGRSGITTSRELINNSCRIEESPPPTFAEQDAAGPANAAAIQVALSSVDPVATPPSSGFKLTAEAWDKASNKADLGRFLDDQVLPRLTAEAVFTDVKHAWQKDGDKWRGDCLWHKSRSRTAFYINARTLAWRCPGCGIGGGPVQYLWKRKGGRGGSPRGKDFVDVLRELADLAGVAFPEQELTEEQKERQRKLETRRAILASTVAICQKALAENAGSVLAWLKTRGLSKEDAEELGLGLYPDTLRVEAQLEAEGYTQEDIKESSVLMSKMVGYVTVPWLDDHGRLLTIYGSWPGKPPPAGKPSKMALPNPREGKDPLESTKRSPLYLDRALAAHHDEIVLVEGVIDAAVAQCRGDTRVVACVAAELSHQQTETLKRRGVKSVTICLDPDDAGGKGTLSCVKQLLATGIAPYVAPRLPEGVDPDDLINDKGIDAWKKHLADADHGLRWLARQTINQAGKDLSGDRRRQAIKDACAECLAKNVPPAAMGDVLLHFRPELAKELDVSVDDIKEMLSQATTQQNEAKTEEPKTEKDTPKPDTQEYDFRPITSREFAAGDYRPTWLIKWLLVKGQPALIGGPKKVLKTTLLIDLAVALASGEPFLGHQRFEITKRYRTAMLSGESGQHTLQETAFRVCAFHGLKLKDLDILWDFRLPQLSDQKQLDRFRKGLERHKVEVVVVDPLYLCLLGGSSPVKSSDVFGMGPLLLTVSRACLDVGATPILSHHTIKRLVDPFAAVQLEDLSQAGFAEFARQWLLINRREAYDPEKQGSHKLWFNVGGSVGHGGCWGIDVEEGWLQEDFSGRVWNPVIVSGSEAIDSHRKSTAEKKETTKRIQLIEDCNKILNALDKLALTGKAAYESDLRARSNVNGSRWTAAIANMLDDNQIAMVTLDRKEGKGPLRVKGWKRP
jgi:hypothetical protein